MDEVLVLEDADAVAAATHPVRAAILDALRRPATAAEVARRIGQSRQNVAYHVRTLHEAGLVRLVEERRRGAFVEQVYEAAAPTFVVSPTCTWGDPAARSAALADQLSLGELVAVGEQLQHDSARLLDRAAFDGAQVPSASVVTEVRFASVEAREAFLHDYLEAVTALARQHADRDGVPYRLVLASYPHPEGDDDD